MEFLNVKVTSICDGKVCYEPTGSTNPFPLGTNPYPVPTAVPTLNLKKYDFKKTWLGELFRLWYMTELGGGRLRIPRLPPPRVPRY